MPSSAIEVMMFTVILVTVSLWSIQTRADCKDIQEQLSLRKVFETPKGVRISYSYDFTERDHYFVSWSKDREHGGPFGPLLLSRGCAPAEYWRESEQVLILSNGCGSFCWVAEVIPLKHGATGMPVRFNLPLEWDATRNLLVSFPPREATRNGSADTLMLRITNLVTGETQDIHSEIECIYSELCFEDLRLTENSLEFTSKYPPQIRYKINLEPDLVR